MTAKARQLTLMDQRLIKALKHSTRSYALNVCTHRPASPKEVARELGKDVSEVSYHFDQLVKLGCLEIVKEKKRRGATEHWYRATVEHLIDVETWKRVPPEDRPQITLELIDLMSRDIVQAATTGTLDQDDNHISRTILKLDKEGWGEIVSRLRETLDDVLRIKEEAALRLIESNEKAIETRVNIIHFEAPPQGELGPAPQPTTKRRRRTHR